MRLVLVARDPELQNVYLENICSLDVCCDTASNLEELAEALLRAPCSGLLLDVPTMLRGSQNEKAMVHDLLEAFPVLRLRFDPGSGRIGALMYGSGSRTTIRDFVEDHCRAFTPRRLRLSTRTELHCPVLLSPDEGFSPERTEKSVTVNLSRDGSFIYSASSWSRKDIAWIRFPFLKDFSPIAVEIRWNRSWGDTFGIPGVGVRFLEISASQQEEIQQLLPALDGESLYREPQP
ncbi:PilZ domain-containing protein [Geoalkalibacter ferrihydriticus]|uniref:PilZ domain-containing protein n=1 Tax=Geoalkalibacter ferrihydriticus TaxID=392333 RepID=UPI0013792AD8|nr:PilZ domain-containing protein [Geoalkalibacter ferrihydriticus]